MPAGYDPAVARPGCEDDTEAEEDQIGGCAGLVSDFSMIIGRGRLSGGIWWGIRRGLGYAGLRLREGGRALLKAFWAHMPTRKGYQGGSRDLFVDFAVSTCILPG